MSKKKNYDEGTALARISRRKGDGINVNYATKTIYFEDGLGQIGIKTRGLLDYLKTYCHWSISK